ncbi:DUF3153 domain-containing protein [Crossiella sp. SN42]|uniref:DUF3153 domain-containing protein n=1 Tax=Crossiella sp. SN42 TaxID=2944808 RepID=UPI00207C130D|nr:DUF3153 domain-containing protein [Crossiella sp. SN42]MCO1581730.1 DUF3153 domain-containing protein [Crossiella sp. SN42]
MPLSRRLLALPLLGLLCAFFLSGCVRASLTMAVTEDDRVSGELVLLTLPTREGDLGPQLKVPAELASRVRVLPHSRDGYSGSQLFFNGLTFEELRGLASATELLSTNYRLQLRRSGGLVTLSGAVDLTSLAPERTDVQLKISFPGRIASTNGKHLTDGIGWSPKAGEITELAATVSYADQRTESWEYWAMVVAGGSGGVALLVYVMAFVAHRRYVARLDPVE